jgi:Kef-type K+ transport system membrane component KefB
LAELGRPILAISIGAVVVTAVVVGGGLALLGMPLATCLLLAGISTSTDPAATVDVIAEASAKGPFSDTLLAVVAFDDVWGLMLFSLTLAVAGTASGAGGGLDVIVAAAWELGGAIAIGVALGVPMAYLTGRIEPGEPTLGEALGVVFLCGGIALWLDVSFLLAAMTLGAVVANLAKRHTRPFHAIKGVEAPFLVLFFVLAGASVHVEALLSVGTLGIAFVVLRAVSRLIGGMAGGAVGGLTPIQRRWIGAALMPQAGVALGTALLASERFPELADQILPIAVGSTIVFELFGPIATRVALRRVGEAQSGS